VKYDSSPFEEFHRYEDIQGDIRFPDTPQIISARAKASAIHWGFGILLATIVTGIGAIVALSIAKLETNTLREMVMTLGTGEIGLIAGLFSERER
jgi:hypothetical protein